MMFRAKRAITQSEVFHQLIEIQKKKIPQKNSRIAKSNYSSEPGYFWKDICSISKSLTLLIT